MFSMNEGRQRVRAALVVISCAAVAAAVTATRAESDQVGKVASMQNQVETKVSEAVAWEPSILHQALHGLDRIRTGPESRAAILYSDQTLQRINEKSEVEILAPSADSPGALRVISGTHYFSSRKPKDYGRIETPTVTAAIRGTEFVVEVVASGATTITMLEGVVHASNSFGDVEITRGEQAYVERGKAPVKRIAVRPRDAVSWSIYYPRVLGGSDATRLAGMGADGQKLVRAAELLSVGQVGQAAPLIAEVRANDPDNAVALSLASVIDVAADRKEEGMKLAERAVESDSDSAAAALALSFASQSQFDIARALDEAERSVRLDPDNVEARARVAELRMATGDTRGAREAAEKAVKNDPGSARALTVLGFVQLAELRSAQALSTFERAVAADPGFPLARLGLGIARIRRGDLTAGREEMQNATILDPDNALFRSYLAKAYYEEKRNDESMKELETAKQLDPSDPTAYLYDAIRKQTYNRPVEALDDLRQSIELNDKRAVYRSRLLLDEDQAVRSADLASIYNDLGFEQLGMVTARSSADADQSNYSSHMFLAGNYRNLPGFAPAFLSETLQARIYQPVGVNAVRPDVVNESVSFNEYTSLIDRPRLRGFVGATYGEIDTDLSELFDPDDPTEAFVKDLTELSDSDVSGMDATITLNRERFAGALSFSTSESDGFRINSDESNDVARGFFVFAPSYRDQFQINFIDGSRETGDLPLRRNPVQFAFERFETDLTNVGLGYHRIISPAADFAVSVISNDAESTGVGLNFDPDFNLVPSGMVRAELDGLQIEAQYVLRQERLTWTAGAGSFDGEQKLVPVDPVGTSLSGDDQFRNGYVYVKFRDLGPVDITAGASYEDLTAPIGLLPPRDSRILPGEVQFEDSKLNPKVGLSARATSKTVVRATAYSRLTPAIGRLQTLEPTQVAGFNQFFGDPAGTFSTNYGVGLDQEFTRFLFGGLSLLRRDLEIPEPTCENPDPAQGCTLGTQPAIGFVERNSDDWLGNIYLNATAGRRVAASIEYAYEERDFDFTQKNQIAYFESFVRTQRVRPEVRAFFPFGLFAKARATYFGQDVDQFEELGDTPERTNTDFWIGDVQIGYRFPKRWGSVTLDALNITDESFISYRSSLEEGVFPARTILLSVNFTSN